jgi:predicted DNA-binding transcriptional regulator AlpA
MSVSRKPTKQITKLERQRRPGKAAAIGNHPLQLYRPGRLAQLLDVHLSTLWRWQRDGVLPRPVQIGPYVRGWTREQIEHLLKPTVQGGN